MTIGKSFLGIKQPDRDADYSLTSNAKLKNGWSVCDHSHVIRHDIALIYLFIFVVKRLFS